MHAAAGSYTNNTGCSSDQTAARVHIDRQVRIKGAGRGVSFLRGAKDDAFYNTARYGVRLALAIPALIIWSLVYFLIFKWYIALGLLILSLPSLKYLYDYGLYFRRLCSDIRWKFKKKKAPDIGVI